MEYELHALPEEYASSMLLGGRVSIVVDTFIESLQIVKLCFDSVAVEDATFECIDSLFYMVRYAC